MSPRLAGVHQYMGKRGGLFFARVRDRATCEQSLLERERIGPRKPEKGPDSNSFSVREAFFYQRETKDGRTVARGESQKKFTVAKEKG